jgi:hypothetical protein
MHVVLGSLQARKKALKNARSARFFAHKAPLRKSTRRRPSSTCVFPSVSVFRRCLSFVSVRSWEQRPSCDATLKIGAADNGIGEIKVAVQQNTLNRIGDSEFQLSHSISIPVTSKGRGC